MPRTYWLSTHLGYRCRHSGACCTARWPIPIEEDRATAVRAAIDARRIGGPSTWLSPAPDAPAGVAGMLALQASGACVFFRHTPDTAEHGGCAIHAMRPASCEHFPWVSVIDPRGVHVTLSHFCPTAASMLFETAFPVGIVSGPPVFEDGRLPEGLDATEALPPRAADTPRLLSWEETSAWAAARVAALSVDGTVPGTPDAEAFDRARRAVPAPWTWPAIPPDLEGAWSTLVAPAWSHWAPVVGRYLASKVHASWALFLGDGLAAVDRHVTLARTVLQVEAVRQCQVRGGSLDRTALTEAIRQSDLLLVHLADPDRLHQAVQLPIP